MSVVSQIIDKSARATLNNMEPKINVMGDAVEEIRSCLILFGTETDVIQDKVDDCLNVLEDEVERIHGYLNTVVDRINEVRKRVETLTDKDLRSHEEMDTSDDQVARIKNDNTQ